MQTLANVDGRIQPVSEVRISPLDRGFLFGDAVYEVMRIYGGKPFLLDEHLARLGRSLEIIRIPGINLHAIAQRIHDTIAAGPFGDGMAYVQITRGAYATRSHVFPTQTVPYEILWVEELTDPYVDARKVGVKVVTQRDLRWERCDVKSVNLLPNILAAQAAREAGAVEAILHTPDGMVTEGSRTNVFAVIDGMVRTRPLGPEILPGITREFVLHLANECRIPVEERAFTLADLSRASELFLSGTTSEVLPIVEVDGKRIGDGMVGKVATRLHEAFRVAVARA